MALTYSQVRSVRRTLLINRSLPLLCCLQGGICQNGQKDGHGGNDQRRKGGEETRVSLTIR
jgi:hypothetical protein